MMAGTTTRTPSGRNRPARGTTLLLSLLGALLLAGVPARVAHGEPPAPAKAKTEQPAPAVSSRGDTGTPAAATTVRKRRRKKRRRSSGGPLLRAKLSRRWWLHVPIEGGVASGWFDGVAYRRREGALLDLEVDATPMLRYRRTRFQLRLPLRYEGRQTFGASLSEHDLEGGLVVAGRPVRALTLRASGGVKWVSRPGWPDEYQPVLDVHGDPSGDLEATDRFGFFQAEAGAEVGWRFGKALRLEGYGGWLDRRYTQDADYDDLLRPTHLVPGDLERWRAGLKAKGKVWRWRWLVDARVEWRSYRFAFARDAQTGQTHAPPGGTPANPLQRFLRVRARHRSSIWLGFVPVRVIFTAAYTHNQDEYDGYYTWDEVGVGVALRARPIHRLQVEVGWEGDFRWYTDDGFQPGPNHPGLDDGAVRASVRHGVRGEIAYALWDRRLHPFVDVEWARYRTNFPDYVPYENPAPAPYAIDFDYDNLVVRAGMKFDF